MIYVVAALVLGAVTVFNVKTVLEANHVYDLTMTSIDALSENSDGESGESGGSTEMEKVIQVLISLTKGNVIIRMAIGIWH